MNRIIYFLLLLVSSQVLFAQRPPEIKELKKLGLIPVSYPYLYLFETEVSNADYKEYQTWLKENADSNRYKASLLDTLAWRKILSYYEPLVKHYHVHSAYSDYPMVNISQQQARDFCLWKTDRLNEYLNTVHTEIDSIIVRLPSENEWMNAARIGLPNDAPFPWNGAGIRRKDKKHRGEVQLNVISGRVKPGEGLFPSVNYPGFVTTPVKSYWPSEAGLWNMSGNVSEWIEESGKSKGGSWNQGAYRARIDQPGFYDGDSSANCEIGFRYIVEIVSFKPKKPLLAFEFGKRSFKNSFRPINDSLFAQTTELSNFEYQQFLLENPQPEYQIQRKNWESITPYSYVQQYGRAGLFQDYPVVNISYEAAVAYCAWLTKKYEAWEKRPYKKVVFRLPSQEEWERAARGKRDGSIYPWGGPYVRNSKAQYLANFCPLEEEYFDRNDSGDMYYHYPNNDISISRNADGAEFLTWGTSYFPNGFGFYNMAGNAAEMTNQKGVSRGGSWDSNDFEILINLPGSYTESNCMLGFRVFMEVLEE